VVRKHLRHCVRLFVYASQAAWRVLLKAFAGQTFPALLVLYLYNDDALAKWEIPRIGTAVPMPPADLVFPLPDGHGLWDAQLQGVSFADARLPKLYRLRINHDFPDMVLDDDRLNPWLFTHARELYFESMCVPVMDYALDTDTEEDPPTVQFLVLRDLCATPDDDDFEYDCGPFFSALQTSRVHSLVIDALDLDSRIWDDFIGALTVNDPKFPLVTQLMLRQMDFAGMGYELVAFFLSAFPALEHFLIMDCFHERSSTWQDVIETLEMCPTLCVKLRELEVDDGFILRDDPMPFRDFMFDYDLPVE
jgi:hypothetical protein